MILLLAPLADTVIAYLVSKLMDRGESFLLLDPRDHPDRFQIDWTSGEGSPTGTVRYDGNRFAMSDISSLYVHILDTNPMIDRAGSDGEGAADKHLSSLWMLMRFAEAVPCLVANRPSAIMSNFSKTYQQRIIQEEGFEVPQDAGDEPAGGHPGLL